MMGDVKIKKKIFGHLQCECCNHLNVTHSTDYWPEETFFMLMKPMSEGECADDSLMLQ